jgi:hypothetical protein
MADEKKVCIECGGTGLLGNPHRIPCYQCQPHKRCLTCRRVYFDNPVCVRCDCGGYLIQRKAGEL